MGRALVDREGIELWGGDVDLVDLEGFVEGRRDLALGVCGEGCKRELFGADLVASLLVGFVGANAQEVAFGGKGTFDQARSIGIVGCGDHMAEFVFEGASDRKGSVALDAVVSVFLEIHLVEVKGFFAKKAFLDLSRLEGTHSDLLEGQFIRGIGFICTKIKDIFALFKLPSKDTRAVGLAECGVVSPRSADFLEDALEIAFSEGLELDHAGSGEVEAKTVSIKDTFDVSCGGSAGS